MRSSYDPFNVDEEREAERQAAERAEHEAWSREQARLNNSATQRSNDPVWIKRTPNEFGEA